MWTYKVTEGALLDPNGKLIANGYSGNGKALNNPDMDDIHEHGPIPKGQWTIGPFFDDPGGKGPVVAHLTPCMDTNTHGRSGFMIHGDNAAANHTASEGCIILPRFARQAIATSADKVLEVIA